MYLHKLQQFVDSKCIGRDESHGYAHMEKVAIRSEYIYTQMVNVVDNNLLQMILAVAWLHDVADHKYHPTKQILCDIETFLYQFYDKYDVSLIMNIIDRISYSKENHTIINNIPSDWEEILGEKGTFIRNIVSDADKLEAIGKEGLLRCQQFTEECYIKKYNKSIPYHVMVNNVVIHAKEKLLRLYTDFIHTEPGKRLAKPLHDELVTELDKLCYLSVNELYKIAPGLNIEGGNPGIDLGSDKIWACLCLVLDRPLIDDISFDYVMNSMKENAYPLLENTIDTINEKHMIAQMILVALYYIELAVEKCYRVVVFHFHQDKIVHNLISIFDKYLHDLIKIIGINVGDVNIKYRTDNRIYLETDINNDGVDIVVSFSQCAGLDAKYVPGTMLVPNEFIPMNFVKKIIYCHDKYTCKNDLVDNYIDVASKVYQQNIVDYVNDNYMSASKYKHENMATIVASDDFVVTTLLQVSDLWVPDKCDTYKIEICS